MHSLADRWTTRTRRRAWTLISAAIIATLMMAIAAPAQAAPNVATAWGRNTDGRLGVGTTEGPEKCGEAFEACSTVPVEVSKLSGVTAVSAGQNHSLALLENGTVMAWGLNGEGQLGNGTHESSDVPVAAGGLSEVAAIAAGYQYSLALLKNGTVMAWGANSSGQLGNGTHQNSNVPVAVSGLSGVTAIAAGTGHSLALLSNGTVMAWGSNLGNGTEETSDVPVAVGGLTGVTAIAASGLSQVSLALLSTGKVMAWGANQFGQLGTGTTTNSNVPVEVSKLGGVTAIAAGAEHMLALLSDGTVMAWGHNAQGQLGDGTSTGPQKCGEPPFESGCSKVPVAVSNLGGVTAIAAGGHSLALLGSGTAMAWGPNKYGQLGDGTSTGPEPCGPEPCATKPVAVSTHGAVFGISAGRDHSLAFGPPPPPPNPLPELGRCAKVTTKGAYRYAGCVIPSPGHTGSFEWMPGPGAKPKFAGRSIGTVALETVGKANITCSTGTFKGEYSGPKTATVSVAFTGCKNSGEQSCQSAPVIPGEIQNPTPEEAELGFITGGATPTVGTDLKPKSPSTHLWTFECGRPPEKDITKGTIEGSVIAPIKKIDAMTGEFRLTYKATGGRQIPERFEGGLKDTLIITSTTGVEKGEKSEEQAGVTTTVTIPNEEPLEIKAKP